MMTHVAMTMMERAILRTTHTTMKTITSLVKSGTHITRHATMTMVMSLVKRLIQMMMCFTMTIMTSLAKRVLFLEKVHNLLQQKNHSDIISWLPDGESFIINNKKVFESD